MNTNIYFNKKKKKKKKSFVINYNILAINQVKINFPLEKKTFCDLCLSLSLLWKVFNLLEEIQPNKERRGSNMN